MRIASDGFEILGLIWNLIVQFTKVTSIELFVEMDFEKISNFFGKGLKYPQMVPSTGGC